MNDDTGMTSIVSQLHKRLDEARTSARTNLPPVEELVGWKQGDEDNTAASVSEVESEQETNAGDQRTLVTPPPQKESDDGKETSASATEADPGSRQCTQCGKRYHAEFPDEEHPDLCEECLVSKTEAAAPTTAWREESLGRLDEAILDVLHEAYPQELSASEIADRLPARNIEPAEANRSAVNSELYGGLRDWLKKKGRRPPVWSLQPAEERIDASDQTSAQSDQAPSETAGSMPVSSLSEDSDTSTEGETAATARRSSESGEQSPVACAICSEPMENSHKWRGERMCSGCYELFSDLRE